MLERLDLPEGSSWALLADSETWILALDGHAAIGLAALSIGQAIFVSGDRTSIEVGASGLSAVVAYPGAAPVAALLQTLGEPSTGLVPLTPAPELTGLSEART